MNFYKYRGFTEYSLNGLARNQVYLSSFEEFNDPFEFSNPVTDLRKYNKNAREELRKLYSKGVLTNEEFKHLVSAVKEPDELMIEKRSALEAKVHKGLPDYGIFCLSKSNDNILMWSHYANDHKGFCIEFNELSSKIEGECLELDVNYVDKYIDINDPGCIIDFYIEMFANSRKLSDKKWRAKYKKLQAKVNKEEDTLVGKTVLSTKYSDWSYEKEVRLISTRKGLHSYPPECVKKIIFGIRTSEADKGRVREICSSSDKQHVKFAQAVKMDDAFGLTIRNENCT